MMNRFSVLIAEILIFLTVLGLKIYVHKKRVKKIKCIEMKKDHEK